MMRTSLSTFGAIGAASLSLVACIGPQSKQADCPCACAEKGAGEAAAAEEDVTAVEVPPAMKPTGTLIFDGTSNVLNDYIDAPGSWFVFNDGSPKGTMIPESTADVASVIDGNIHSEGKGFGVWGGGIGFNFVGAQMITPCDATEFKGLKFKASGKGPLHVALATVATMPEFGICAENKCYDHFAVDINLTSDMKEYAYEWGQLKQAGWGTKAKLDPTTLIGFNFTAKGPTAWNFTIDDIEFIK